MSIQLDSLELITLLTDFSLQDGYPRIMKRVIWGPGTGAGGPE